MRVYTLLKQLSNPCKPVEVHGSYGCSILYKGVLNNIPWHIARCILEDTWETANDITIIIIKT